MIGIHGFDWDSGNFEKVQKHGLRIEQIESFFLTSPLTFQDTESSKTETRFFAFDKFEEKILFVAFTIRALDGFLKIRVISARYAHKKEWKTFYGKI